VFSFLNSADNTTLPAFAAERRRHCCWAQATVAADILPAGALSSKPTGRRTMGQTD